MPERMAARVALEDDFNYSYGDFEVKEYFFRNTEILHDIKACISKGELYGDVFLKEFYRIKQISDDILSSSGSEMLRELTEVVQSNRLDSYIRKNMLTLPSFELLEFNPEIYLLDDEDFSFIPNLDDLGLNTFFYFMGFAKVVSLEVYDRYFMPLEKMFLAPLHILNSFSLNDLVVFLNNYDNIINNHLKLFEDKSIFENKNVPKSYSSLESKLVKHFYQSVLSAAECAKMLYDFGLKMLLQRHANDDSLNQDTSFNSLIESYLYSDQNLTNLNETIKLVSDRGELKSC
ncbi:MAG TPA: hypothetical protein DCL21_03040 [Alphaproteobacteria bacterium]|nr:hypothetical protein [Alphaproteobacteria bacterium]